MTSQEYSRQDSSQLEKGPLLSLVYVSASHDLMDDGELEQILKDAHTRNAPLEVTGMLLYYGGSFMQALEGPEANVRMVYDEICQDERHHYVIKLVDEYIAHRNFPDWSMGYKKLQQADAESIEGFRSFNQIDKFLEYFKNSPQKALTLLKSFRNSHRR